MSMPHIPHTDLSAPQDKAKRFAQHVRPLGIAFNGVFVILFVALRVWPLATVFLAGFVFHLWFHHCAGQPGYDVRALMRVAGWLLLGQLLLAVALIGPRADFQSYLIASLPAIFYNLQRSMSSKLVQAGTLILAFLLCDNWVPPGVPYVLPAGLLAALSHFNSLCTCLMLAAMAHAQALTVAEAERALQRVADTDVLTGLLNRRAMSGLAGAEAARGQRQHHPPSFVLADIDYFKRINDKHGHASGDQVLREVARRIAASLREYDRIARWGGEEFLLLLPETTAPQAAQIAERLRLSIAASPIEIEGHAIPVTLTFGAAMLGAAEGWEETLERADKALYRGKAGGRNRVETG